MVELVPLFLKLVPKRYHPEPPAPAPVPLQMPAPADAQPTAFKAPAITRLSRGLCINGYLRSEIGLGQAARNLAYACDTQRLPLSLRHLDIPSTENDPEFLTKVGPDRDRLANMLVCGLPAILHMPEEIAPGRFNIFYPFWELPTVPAELHPLLDRFDQIWCASTFIEKTIRQFTSRPVHLLRQPVWTPPSCPPPRKGRTGLRVLTFFDHSSYLARKNPMGAVAAFCAAFPDRRDVELVVKCRGAETVPSRQDFTALLAGDSRIRVVDTTLDRAGMDALIDSCDVFISMHRSEGFGFGGAEALARGKAVVSTDFSGTTDFITPETGYPVPYRLRPVREDEYIMAEGAVWAEPDIEAAADLLRQIYDDPVRARERTERGFSLLQDKFSFDATGQEIARLLQESGLV